MKEIQKRFEAVQDELKESIEGLRVQMIRNRGKEIIFGNKDKVTRATLVIPIREKEAPLTEIESYAVIYDKFCNDGSAVRVGVNKETFNGYYEAKNIEVLEDTETTSNTRNSSVSITPTYKSGELYSLEILSVSTDSKNKSFNNKSRCNTYSYKQQIIVDNIHEKFDKIIADKQYIRVEIIFAQTKIPPVVVCSAQFVELSLATEQIDPQSIYFWEYEQWFLVNSYNHEFEITNEVIEKNTTKNLNVEKISSSVDSIINASTLEKEMILFTEDGFVKEYYRPGDGLTAKYVPVPNVYYDKSFDIVYTIENETGDPVEIDRVKYRYNKNFEYCVGKFYGIARKLNEDGTIKKFAHFRPFEVVEVEVVEGKNGNEQIPHMYSNAVLELAEFEKEEWCIITTKEQSYIGKTFDTEDDNHTRTIKYDLTLDIPTETENFVKVTSNWNNRSVEIRIGKMIYNDIHCNSDTSGVTAFCTKGISFSETDMPYDKDGIQSANYCDNDFEVELRNNRIVKFNSKLYIDGKPEHVYTRDFFGVPCNKHIWFDAEPNKK